MTKQETTERFKAIQRRLGVEDDGILGPVTLSSMEKILDQVIGPPKSEEIEPEYSLVVSRAGLEQLVQFEISSEAYYRRYLSHPTYPGGESGITIGIGYDLGYNTKAQIGRDWRGKTSDADLKELLVVAGLKKDTASDALPSVEHIKIPLQAAKEVFYTSSLPKYAKLTRKAYPGVEDLPGDAQAMLLSLVFNRGIKKSGSRRREMKAIEPMVIAKDLKGIAEQIRSMKRLWDKEKLRGLHDRRDKEAQIIEEATIEPDTSELFKV